MLDKLNKRILVQSLSIKLWIKKNMLKLFGC